MGAIASDDWSAESGADDDPTSVLGTPYGQAAAIDAVGTTAAPPLAGFAFALIVLIIQAPDGFAAPDAALALLTGAAVFLITSIQLTFTHRRLYVPPDTWAAWLDLVPGEQTDDARKIRQRSLNRQYMSDIRRAKGLRTAAAWTYNAGIALLLAGVTVSLWPEEDGSVARWAAVGVAGAALIAEVIWAMAVARVPKQAPRRRRAG